MTSQHSKFVILVVFGLLKTMNGSNLKATTHAQSTVALPFWYTDACVIPFTISPKCKKFYVTHLI